VLGSSFLCTPTKLAFMMRSLVSVEEPERSGDERVSDHTTSSIQHDLWERDPDPTLDRFLQPPPFGITGDFSNDTTWTIGQTIEVSWISEWQSVDLLICQPTTGPSHGCYTLISGILGKGFHWPVDNVTLHMTGFQSPSIPNIYYFQLKPTDTENPMIQSHYFNIAENNNSTNTTGMLGGGDGASNTDPGPAGLTSSNVTTTSSTSATSAADASRYERNSILSVPAQIAVSVVAGIIALGLVLASAFFLILRRRKRKRAAGFAKITIEDSVSALTSPVPMQELHAEPSVHETGKALPHEIASKEIPMELPAEVPGLAISRYEDDDDDQKWDDANLDNLSIPSRRTSS